MKKVLGLFALFICILTLTGCDQKFDFNVAKEKTTKDLKSVAMKMTMDLEMKQGNTTIAMPTTMNMDVDYVSNVAKMDVTVSVLGYTTTVNAYSKKEGEKTITYTDQGDGVWYKSEEKVAGYMDMLDSLDNVAKVEQVDSDDKNCYMYNITLNKEEYSKLIEGMDGVENISVDGNVTIKAYVDKKSEYITKMIADFTDTFKTNTEANISKYIFTIEYSKINEVGSVTIPQNIIDSAIDEPIEDETV